MFYFDDTFLNQLQYIISKPNNTPTKMKEGDSRK